MYLYNFITYSPKNKTEFPSLIACSTCSLITLHKMTNWMHKHLYMFFDVVVPIAELHRHMLEAAFRGPVSNWNYLISPTF